MAKLSIEELIDGHAWIAQQEAERHARSRRTVASNEDYHAAYHALSRAATAFNASEGIDGFETVARRAIVDRLNGTGIVIGSALPHEVDSLVEQHLWLAEEEARKHVRLRRSVGDDEVYSSAYYALTRAAYNFRLERQGVDGFIAYARKAIGNRLKDCSGVIGSRAWVNFSALGGDGHDGGDDDVHGAIESCAIEDRLPPVVPGRDAREDEAEAERAHAAAELVERGLAEIGEPYAKALRLQFGIGCKELTPREIAKRLKVSPAAAAEILAEGAERLRSAVAMGR